MFKKGDRKHGENRGDVTQRKNSCDHSGRFHAERNLTPVTSVYKNGNIERN